MELDPHRDFVNSALYVLERSADLLNWIPFFTNWSSGTSVGLPTLVTPEEEKEFYRLRTQP